jgi:hypothetical protein
MSCKKYGSIPHTGMSTENCLIKLKMEIALKADAPLNPQTNQSNYGKIRL